MKICDHWRETRAGEKVNAPRAYTGKAMCRVYWDVGVWQQKYTTLNIPRLHTTSTHKDHITKSHCMNDPGLNAKILCNCEQFLSQASQLSTLARFQVESYFETISEGRSSEKSIQIVKIRERAYSQTVFR